MLSATNGESGNYGFYPYPAIVFDQTLKVSESKLPPRFRVFPHLQAIGSGEFAFSQLLDSTRNIRQPIYIVDLRGEYHGFINGGIPVSLLNKQDYLNKCENSHRLMEFEVDWLQKQLLHRQVNLIHRDKSKPKYFENSEEDKGIWGMTQKIEIKNVVTEKSLVTELGFLYERIPVLDHFKPTAEEVDRFIQIYQRLPKNTWIYVHCHGGAGRTTTFLAMIDILKNSKNTELYSILQNQHANEGRNLYYINPDRPTWFRKAAQGRFAFLKKFYQYINSKEYANGISWLVYEKSGSS